jgi:uncharacterized integral membrane protein
VSILNGIIFIAERCATARLFHKSDCAKVNLWLSILSEEATMFYLLLLIFVLVGGVVTLVTVENLMTPVHLTLFLWQTPALPLGLVLLAFFLLGALLLYLVSAISAWSDKRELQHLHQRINQLEQQVEQGQTPALPISQLSHAPVLQMPGMYRPPQH